MNLILEKAAFTRKMAVWLAPAGISEATVVGRATTTITKSETI